LWQNKNEINESVSARSTERTYEFKHENCFISGTLEKCVISKFFHVKLQLKSYHNLFLEDPFRYPIIYNRATMATYSNYQLPNDFGYAPQQQQQQQQPQQTYNYSSSAPSYTSNAMVPLYGPPPTPAPRATVAAPAPEIDDDLAAIIASQERAFAEAKNGGNRNNRSAVSAMTTYENRTYENHRAPRVSASGRPLSDAIHPQKYEMKKSRKNKTAAGATGGAIVGGILAGPAFPVGMALGGAAGGYAANKFSKFGERRAQRKHEQSNFQQAASQNALVQSEGVAFA
jgi:hypothetical protein